MCKKNLVPTIIFLILTLPIALSQKECVPDYQCGEWGECRDGFHIRTCLDVACNQKEIIERSFCSSQRCTPKIECGEWSECSYDGRTDNLIKGEIIFGGTKTRICDDLNDCIPRYIQSSACEDSFPLHLSPAVECGENLLVAKDSISGYTIAKINLDSWKNGKFDLAFVQGKRVYCSSCYNTIKDNKEEGIDCGGECKPCRKESNFIFYLLIFIFWTGSLTFIFLSFKQYHTIRKELLNREQNGI